MQIRNARDENEILMERIIRVENSLFRLKMMSQCFSSWDNTEVERLEHLRLELRDRYERQSREKAGHTQSASAPRY